MYYLPIVLTIVANIIYHIAQKYTPDKVNPFCALSITYGTALVISVILYFCTKKETMLADELHLINAASVVLGIAIVLLEFGFLLAYRYGWDISITAIVSNVMVAVCLVPIGILFFQESFSWIKAVGIILSIAGIICLNH